MLVLDFHVISIFCLHRTFYKIHTWKLFVYWKIIAQGKIKSGRKSLVKKKKKNKKKGKKLAQRKKKEYHSVKKRKNSFVKATGTLVSRSISNKEVAVKPKFAYVIFQTRFPFLYASTGLDIKTLTIASNRNFESCMSIRCLAPQHISGFFIFAAGFFFAFGNFAHYCVVLLKAPLSNWI